MGKNFENILNQALAMLKAGHSKEEVLLKYADYKKELSPLISLSATLLSIPKNTVPTPLMSRKYALAASRSFWLAWFHLPKFATAGLSLVLLVSTFTVVGYQASKSSSGQTLFTVKKSTEKLQLILAADQSAKASLQIKFAEKRLSEAESILANPNSAPEQKTAALEELASQTTTAVAEVDTATQNNPEASHSDPLLASLDGIAGKQQTLLEGIETDSQIKPAAETALVTLGKTTEKISAIKQTVAIAASERALAQLKNSKDSVVILGDISQITKEKIVVEKTEFLIDDKTVIKDATGTTISLKELKLQTKVNVVGQKHERTLIAKQIVIDKIIAKETTSNSPASTTPTTTIPATGTSTQPTITSTPGSIKKLPEQESSPTTSPEKVDPNSAIGSFILEDPAPQYVE